ncbi:heparan-alpha-glucosaminide N-acetyltransferase domain-containing protein [Rosettibacter firmus]|uniref:heparan-alpha-glucosaminide N-acetyltransferase domain-containing protein n=1 Tax=Rosettibacter firmus TaxID=3111522 RepID=UPI00336C2A61
MQQFTPKRVIFIDLMRAFAVLMMVQGHTIDTFLSDDYRTFDSILYSIWFTIRGFTAPIFMFSSGAVFTYLLKSYKVPFVENPRVVKGFKRFLMLIVIGYLLRYPSYSLIDFSLVTREQWLTFFVVDALHLIGFGLLFILILTYISERIRVKDYIIYSVGALFFFLMFNITEQINWHHFLPLPLAAYFFHKTGSLFPFFPWAGYVISGAILGNYLANNPDIFTKKVFSRNLLIIGLLFWAFAYLIELIEMIFFNNKNIVTDNLFVISLRLGGVILLNCLMSYLAIELKTIPNLVKWVGRHTLVIYAVHVIILYGSAWIPGLNLVFAKSMSISLSILAAIMMIILMILMVIAIEKIKSYWKNRILLEN